MSPGLPAATVFTLDLNRFAFELDEGAVKHVGASNTAATAKLYDVEAVGVREFGDERVKFAFEDGEGNEVEVALPPEEARDVARAVESLAEEGGVFE